jgi:hypothetical protein
MYNKSYNRIHKLYNWTDTRNIFILNTIKQQTNSLDFGPQANYTDWSTATSWRILVPNFADRRVSRGTRGGSPTVANPSFLDRSRYFSIK